MNPVLFPVLIFLFPFLSALAVPFFRQNRHLPYGIALFGLGGSVLFSLAGLIAVQQSHTIRHYLGGWIPPYGIEWRLDGLSAFMALLASTIAFIVTLATRETVEKEIGKTRIPYYMILLLHISALLGIILTHDFFNFFVFLEVASLTGYALVASGDTLRGNVASFRYLLIGTVGASLYLLGVGYLYAATGTLNMSDMSIRIQEVLSTRTVWLGLLLILLGLAIKMGLFPFHGWLPDAYAFASDSASALIAPVMTKVMLYGFLRIFVWTLGPAVLATFGIAKILTGLATVAIIGGAFMAFVQRNFKRMLAYSSISQIGLIILAFSLQNQTALIGGLLHILNHACMNAVLFLVAAIAADRHGVRDIFDFEKLRGKMPFSLTALTIAALSMVGIPPLAGFFSKWYILVGAFQTGQTWVAAVIVFSSLLTALYFFKVLEQIFFKKGSSKGSIEEGSFVIVFPAICLSAGLFVLGYFAPAIFQWGTQHLVPGGF